MPSKKKIDSSWFESDEQFDKLYPAHIQKLAQKHWTPLAVAKKTANYLVEKNTKILDIGSGVGKFCLVAAYLHPGAQFYGVELRPELHTIATQTAKFLQLKNVHFIEGDFDGLDFSAFNHFYFYNSFYENIVTDFRIDETIELSSARFNSFNHRLFQKLRKTPVGTRLATYHSLEFEIPESYMEISAEQDDLLKFWLKMEGGASIRG